MFVDYVVAKKPISVDDRMPEGKLYQYVLGANGVFVRAERPGLAALIPVALTWDKIRGLADLKPFVRIQKMVPVSLVARMFELAYRAGQKEILFYLSNASRVDGRPWRMTIPEQQQGAASVHPVDELAGGTVTMIEVHSHHVMGAFFSKTDDNEERAGFRVYAVMGGLGNKRPQLRTRVGIYGHLFEFPPEWVFCLPEGLIDDGEDYTEVNNGD